MCNELNWTELDRLNVQGYKFTFTGTNLLVYTHKVKFTGTNQNVQAWKTNITDTKLYFQAHLFEWYNIPSNISLIS